MRSARHGLNDLRTYALRWTLFTVWNKLGADTYDVLKYALIDFEFDTDSWLVINIPAGIVYANHYQPVIQNAQSEPPLKILIKNLI
jgi:hypothetical protein